MFVFSSRRRVGLAFNHLPVAASVWADTPDVAAAYLDQLTRVGGVDAALAGRVQGRIDQWRGGRADKRASAALSLTLTEASGRASGAAATRLRALADLFGRVGT